MKRHNDQTCNATLTEAGQARRRILLGGAASLAGATILGAPAIVRAQAKQPIKVSVGRIPWAAGNSPVTQYMINNKLFEKRAAEQGYDVTIDWRDYPTAMPMVEAVVGNNLDIGMWGNTPIIRGISAGLPISLMAVGEGHLRFVIATRQGSPDPHHPGPEGQDHGLPARWRPVQRAHLDIALRARQPRSEGARHQARQHDDAGHVGAGADGHGRRRSASIPRSSRRRRRARSASPIRSATPRTTTRGRSARARGILIPSVKKSAFYPDGYYLHRSFWIVNNALIDKHPKLVVAYLIAQQEAVVALTAMNPGAVSQLVKEYWKLDPEQGAKAVKDDVLFARGWSWATENDARAVLETSKYLVGSKVIDEPLTWSQVKGAFAKTAPLAKQAYEATGSKPAAAEFTRTDVADLRGIPVWDMNKWTDKS